MKDKIVISIKYFGVCRHLVIGIEKKSFGSCQKMNSRDYCVWLLSRWAFRLRTFKIWWSPRERKETFASSVWRCFFFWSTAITFQTRRNNETFMNRWKWSQRFAIKKTSCAWNHWTFSELNWLRDGSGQHWLPLTSFMTLYRKKIK